MSTDPHANQPVLRDGPPVPDATTVVILLHGRGGVAADALRMARHFPRERVCYLAPQAAGNEWYPQRFLSPISSNEPDLSSALARVNGLISDATAAGVPRSRILVGGFSQGACLALETAVRLGGELGGVFALAGGLIGPPGDARPLDRKMSGTAVFLGCGDLDAHIPLASVQESERVLTTLGARVELQIYRGLGHVIVSDQLLRSAELIQRTLAAR